MSEHRDSTCQKHELPKSLQGTEDAEFVWSMITDRFPNAAPLLCEMEAVIDRAEDLLQQLRTPCREIETSTSFCTPDSQDSTVMISARASIITENDSMEESGASKNVAETQVSESSMCEGNVDANSHSQHSVFKEQEIESQSSDLFVIHRNTEEKYFCVEESSSSKADTNAEQMTKETRSLEEWGKAIDNALKGSIIGITNIRKAIFHILQRSIFIPDKNQPVRETIDDHKKCNNREESKKENNNTNDHQKPCIILHRQEKCPDIGDSTVLIDSNQNARNQGSVETKNNDTNVLLKGSGDKSLPEQRTPLSILEAYAKRCKVPLAYEYVTDGPHRHKSNIYVIRGCLGGFSATCRGDTEESAKNDLAAKILQMIANHQMKDEKFTVLAELSKEEMIEIINLGMDSPRETAQRKLYQLCLEKEEQLPKYSVDKVKTYQGLTYVATCTALGYTGEGRGVRECGAKKAAADELYHQYCQDTKGLKVNLNKSQ